MTRVLMIDDHRLMVDVLDAWLHSHAPDIVLAGSLRAVPCSGRETAALDWGVTVGVLGTLVRHSELVPSVQWLVAAGLRVVVLATTLDGREAGAALAAGALGYVPKTAGPAHTERAIRAAVAGQQYVHPDAAEVLVDAEPLSIRLSVREQRVAELYLGSNALTIRGVADVLGISEQTVKAHLHRIRRRYAAAGIQVGNVISLLRQLYIDGWIT